MSEPIFAALEHDFGVIIHHGKADIQRVWHDITTTTTQHTTIHAAPRRKETPMSVLDDVTALLAPVLAQADQDAATVARLTASSVVAAVEALPQPLDTALEQLIASQISDAGQVAARLAELDAAAAEPAPVPADPAAADVPAA